MSTTKSEYIALSIALRDVIPLISLFKEIFKAFRLKKTKSIIHCKLFKINNSTLELVKVPKIRLQIKYIIIKYYYIRAYVESRKISIISIDIN